MKTDSRLKFNRQDLLFLLLLCVIWGFYSWRWLTPNPADQVMFSEGDFSHHYFVYRTHTYREFQAGRFPLWMDCTFAGYPFQADPQSSLFYLPTTANLLIHIGLGQAEFSLYAYQLEALLHLLLASFLTYWFLRAEIGRRLPALLGSVIFAYSGYLTGYPPLQIAILEGGIWLPLVLWGLRGIAAQPQRRHYIAFVFATVMSVMAGNPQTYLYVGYAAIAYYAYKIWRNKTPWMTAALRIGLSGAAILGLCIVQLWPTLEYMGLSTRASIPFDESGSGFPLRDIVQILLPNVVSLFNPLYFGILPLFLVALAITNGKHRDRWFWTGLVVISFLFSFGKNLFGFEIAYLLAPGHSLMRSQERHAQLLSFGIAVLSAFGVDALLQLGGAQLQQILRRYQRVAVYGTVAALFALLAVVLAAEAEIGQVAALGLGNNFSLLFLMLAATAVLLTCMIRFPQAMRSIIWAALAIIVIDLFTANRDVTATASYDAFPPEPALTEVVADDSPFFRIQDDWRLPGHTACMAGLDEHYGIASINTDRIERFVNEVPEETQWDLLGIKYLVTWKGDLLRTDGSQIGYERVYHDGTDTYTYRLETDPQPAWLVHNWQFVDTQDDAIAVLNTAEFDALTTAVIESPLVIPASIGSGDVDVVTRHTGKLVANVTSELPALLVVSQAQYPGWEATVNGEAAEVIMANGVLQSVSVPSGTSTVVLNYAPQNFWLGVWIAIATLLIGTATLIFFVRPQPVR